MKFDVVGFPRDILLYWQMTFGDNRCWRWESYCKSALIRNYNFGGYLDLSLDNHDISHDLTSSFAHMSHG